MSFALRFCLVLVLLVAASCGRQAAPTPALIVVLLPTATAPPAAATFEDQAATVVATEAEAVRQQDIDALAALWLPDGSVVDANHTADNTGDDHIWHGWAEIRQRYITDVFPYVSEPVAVPRPHVLVPKVTISGNQAEVLVPGPDGQTTQDRWLLRRQSGTWVIAGLTFNLAPLK
ncbi:MAG: hypothetical protein ACUVWR_02310 [Anaerolineae bacterium]